MADLARALQTPVPAPQPAPQQTVVTADDQAREIVAQRNRDEKNKRDQQRRKEKRAADAAHAQAVEAALSKKKKRKPKKKATYRASDRAVMKQLPKLVAKKKVRGRGRPPGSKNKPKPPLMDTVFPGKAATIPANFAMTATLLAMTPDDFAAVQAAVAALSNVPLVRRAAALDMLATLFK